MNRAKHTEPMADFYRVHVQASLWEPGYSVEGDGQITVKELRGFTVEALKKLAEIKGDSVPTMDEAAINYFANARNWPDFQAIQRVVSVEHVRIEITREQFDQHMTLTTTREFVREVKSEGA